MVDILKNTYDEICEALGKRKPECGGVLGARPGEPISKFYFDFSGISADDAYTPDYIRINDVLDEWAKDGVRMVGMIHSHGNAGNFPSCGDLYYCEQILKGNPSASEFLLPIVTLSPFCVSVYRIESNPKLRVSKDCFRIVS